MPAFKINFFLQSVSVSLRHRKKLKSVLTQLINQEKKSFFSGEINVVFCNDDYLLGLNTQFLKHDTLTDIITFDYSDGNNLMGDIFISVERVRDNANTFSQSSSKELYRVIIHGFLHLCGYKDKAKEAKRIMTHKEDFYLEDLEKLINQSNEKNN
ncbi:MAG: rRNA maturation RNase YbeY [Bacteroidota bacterium]